MPPMPWDAEHVQGNRPRRAASSAGHAPQADESGQWRRITSAPPTPPAAGRGDGHQAWQPRAGGRTQHGRLALIKPFGEGPSQGPPQRWR